MRLGVAGAAGVSRTAPIPVAAKPMAMGPRALLQQARVPCRRPFSVQVCAPHCHGNRTDVTETQHCR